MKNEENKQKLTLYRKEQLVLLFLLLSFALSGLLLPKYKTQLSINTPVEDQFLEDIESTDSDIPEDSFKTDSNNVEETTASSDENPTDASAGASDKNASNTTVPTTGTSNNTTSSGSSSNPSSNTGNAQTPSPTPSAPEETEKVWVPPVYQTIHHEAVYQTVRLVVCNYCGASFQTVGEFQVHKDANGG